MQRKEKAQGQGRCGRGGLSTSPRGSERCHGVLQESRERRVCGDKTGHTRKAPSPSPGLFGGDNLVQGVPTVSAQNLSSPYPWPQSLSLRLVTSAWCLPLHGLQGRGMTGTMNTTAMSQAAAGQASAHSTGRKSSSQGFWGSEGAVQVARRGAECEHCVWQVRS